VLILTAAGLFFASLWPEQFESTIAAAGKGWRTWLAGLGVLVSPLVGGGILAFLLGIAPPASAVPVVVILLPIVLGLGGLVLLAAISGVVPAATAMGRVVLRRRASVAAQVLLGMFMVGVITLIPGLRLVVASLVVPLGIGSLLVGRPSQVQENGQ